MNLLWNHGPMLVREMLEYYPEPKPHFNTVATTVRILESKGFVDHEVLGTAHRFRAIVARESVRSRSSPPLWRMRKSRSMSLKR